MEAIPLPSPETFRHAVERLIGMDAFLVASVLFVLGVLLAIAVALTWKIRGALAGKAPYDYVEGRLAAHKLEVSQVLDRAADAYQSSMMDTASRFKEATDEHMKAAAKFMTGVTESVEHLRKTTVSLDRGYQAIKAAMPLLAPKGKAADVRAIFEKVQ